jgi:hypothetical protein
MKTEPGIVFQPNLLMGVSELAFLVWTPAEAARNQLMAQMREPGLVLQPRGCGNMGLRWRVEHWVGGDPLILRFDKPTNGGSRVLAGVMANGTVLVVTPDTGSTTRELSGFIVPDDGAWRTLVVRPGVSFNEPGTITLSSGSKTVTGTGTFFTRLCGRTSEDVTPGDKIFIASGGNSGTWEIDEIVSDTELTLINNASASQTTTWRIAGSYYQSSAPGSPYAHRYNVATFELKSGVVDADPDTHLVLADVMLDTGTTDKIQIIDRRQANMFRMLATTQLAAHLAVLMAPSACNSGTFSDDNYYQAMVADTRPAIADGGGGSADAVAWTSIAPTSDGLGALLISTHGSYVRATTFDPVSNSWPDWDASSGSQVRPDASGNVGAAHIALVPKASGRTHVLAYSLIASTAVYMRTSPDDGATWSSQSLIVTDVNMAGSAPPANYPTPIVLTKSGRLWVVYSFDDGVNYGLRAVYSLDYGATWVTDGGIGFEVISRVKDGVAPWLVPQDVTEYEGRLAILCADRPDGDTTDVYMTVLFTMSTASATWDPGDDIAGATPGGPETVDVTDAGGNPPYRDIGGGGLSLLPRQASSIVPVEGGLAIFHNHYVSDGSTGTGKTWVTVVERGDRADATLTDRRTLEIQQHSEVNWYYASGSRSNSPNQLSARMMPDGRVMAIVRRHSTSARMDSLRVGVCLSPAGSVYTPACFDDLNP